MPRPSGLYVSREKIRCWIQPQNGGQSSQGPDRRLHISSLENVCDLQENQ